MKKLLPLLGLFVLIACNSSKKKEKETTGGPSLEKRLAEYMQLTEDMDLEKLMDYIYPRLFKIAPKEQMIEAMREGFNNEELKMSLDSLKVDKIYPIFTSGKGQYAKVTYTMVMIMDFLDKEGIEDQMELIMESMGEKYGRDNIRIDDKTGNLRVKQTSHLVAAKDEYAKDWSFVSLRDDDPMINQLLDKQVLDKLDDYK